MTQTKKPPINPGGFIASFMVGYIFIGVPLRKKGIRKKTVDLIASSVTAICVIGGYSVYRSLT